MRGAKGVSLIGINPRFNPFSMGNLFDFKKYTHRYVSVVTILLIDLFISLSASVVALLLTNFFVAHQTLTWTDAFVWLAISVVASLVSFLVFRTNRIVIRHSTLRDMAKFFVVALLKMLILFAGVALICKMKTAFVVVTAIIDAAATFAALMVIRIMMVYVYDQIKRGFKAKNKKQLKVLVYGSGDKSVAMITRLDNSPHYSVVGFLTYKDSKYVREGIDEHRVFYFSDKESLKYLRDEFDVDAILFATEDEARAEQKRLIRYANDSGLKVLIVPSIDECIDGKVIKQGIREIKIEDLLGREEIKLSMDAIQENFAGKTVMVTGAAGSIGSELCRQLAGFGVKHLVLFDNAETPMHNIRLELEARFPELEFTPVIGDVRQEPRLDFAFRTFRPQVVFHAAAYKHVPLMEENPCEAVYVNVVGSRYVANKCVEYGVEKMVMVSTDKAVNPTNIMGCTKRLAEIYVQSLGLALQNGQVKGKTRFVTTRFGNVLGSNGSVIPRFRDQIRAGGPVTVTHPDITRFFMTIPEACRLVMEAATMSKGNEIFVFDMGESVKISSLAKKMIYLAGFVPDKDIKIEYTGLRPGEKLYEEVLSNTENTLPTSHDRIRIAKVREYDHAEANEVFDQLYVMAKAVNIPEMVRLMKRTVPEYISKNSRFEEYDNEEKK